MCVENTLRIEGEFIVVTEMSKGAISGAQLGERECRFGCG